MQYLILLWKYKLQIRLLNEKISHKPIDRFIKKRVGEKRIYFPC